MSCHAIVHVGSTMGNADFTVEYPPLHELASSHNRYIRAIDYFLTYLNPKPHRRPFMKPFMREQSAEFCAACHKVHLDVPVNSYRWVRGFNDYDNWQASGVSGQGARSFYYPRQSSGLRRLPHAAGGFARSRAIATARCIRIASRPPIPRCPTPIRTRRN